MRCTEADCRRKVVIRTLAVVYSRVRREMERVVLVDVVEKKKVMLRCVVMRDLVVQQCKSSLQM